MPDKFSYDSFHIAEDNQTVLFDYVVIHDNQSYRLRETLKFPLPLIHSAAQQSSLRALHIALGISYYKIFSPPSIQHPYAMNEAEANFWNDVWRHGLGEFLYINKLSPDILARFSAQQGQTFSAYNEKQATTTHALLGIGGGKDSIVAGEILKQLDVAITGYVMATGEQRGQALAVATTMQIPLLVVERTLDQRLLELQELSGAHKGHVPISLIFGLVGTVLAVASHASYIVVANEASASIPRAQSEYGAINHQWSKSFAAERALQQFIRANITPSATYFSAIRPLSSVAVAKLFARYPAYLQVFTSDNTVFRIDPSKRPNARWSLESPKSLSSFILLAPWLPGTDILTAFGRDFLDESSLETLFWSLLGVEGEQPLDCVGTVEELILSLNLVAEQGKFTDSVLMKAAVRRGVVHANNWQDVLRRLITLQPEQAMPPELAHPLISLFKEMLT